MKSNDLLNEALALGVLLNATADGKIHWRSPGALPEPLRQRIVAHKAELLKVLSRPAPSKDTRKPWNPTPEEEAAICRIIEKDQGLSPGAVRLYTPKEFRERFGCK